MKFASAFEKGKTGKRCDEVESYEDAAATLGKKDGDGVKIAVIFQGIDDDCDDGND